MSALKKSIPMKDIFELPGIRNFKTVTFANDTVRREGKALLWVELHAAVKSQGSLSESLSRVGELNGETGETEHRSFVSVSRSLSAVYWVFMLMMVVLTAGFVALILLFNSARFSSPEQISRVLARRLYRHVNKGHSLSDAMRACSPDYTRAEIELIRAAEERGHLEEALRQLSHIDRRDCPLGIHKSHIGYPLFVLMMVFSIYSFLLVFIAPKVNDLISQLNAPLWYPFVWAFSGSGEGAALFNLFVSLLGFIFSFALLRALMNGTPDGKALVSLVIFFVCFGMLSGALVTLHEDIDLGILPLAGIGIVGVGVILYYLPSILGGLERIVLFLERSALGVLSRIPLIGESARLKSKNMWLASLALGLRSGMTPAEVLMFARRTSSAVGSSRTKQAISLVEGGHPIGYACVQAGLLPPRIAHRLALVDGRIDYLGGLSQIIDEINSENDALAERHGSFFEGAATLAAGVISFFIAASLFRSIMDASLVHMIAR